MKIDLSGIGKKYGKHWIFRHVEATFEPGGIYGITGFNGSGKSTLLQIISGYVTPSEGTISYGSLPIEQVHQQLSMSAPYMDLMEEFTVSESIALQANFKPFQDGTDAQAILDEMELANHAHKLLSELSSGMRQRLKLALAIKADSHLLLLDEPCANLDKRWTTWFNEALGETMHSDRTVIICSNSQEVELKSVDRDILDVSVFHA